MTRSLVSSAAFLAVLAAAPSAFADEAARPAAGPASPVVAPAQAPVAGPASGGWWCSQPCDPCPCPTVCAKDPLWRIPCLDDCLDSFAAGKEKACFRLGAFAYHWWNLQNQGDRELTYGYPSATGTYFWAGTADLECCHCDVQYGFHAQLRARDESYFRSFFDHEVWFYELYGFAKKGCDTLKFGKIWKRFGLDWDGTFWGNVAYYDGMKLDPDWGVSWERSWSPNQRLTIDTFAQWFLKEDEVNGSIAGADPESTDVYKERHTFVGRVAPKVRLDNNLTVGAGASVLFAQIDHDEGAGEDDTLSQWAIDAYVQWCGLKVFAEYAHSDGEQNPAHYVTGGPSDVYDDVLVGAEWKIGPFTPRVVYSQGDYENPGGSQDLWLVGGTIELTKYVTFYVEYVMWNVTPSGGAKVVYEDGFQFVLNWHI